MRNNEEQHTQSTGFLRAHRYLASAVATVAVAAVATVGVVVASANAEDAGDSATGATQLTAQVRETLAGDSEDQTVENQTVEDPVVTDSTGPVQLSDAELSAEIEAELAALSPEEKAEMVKENRRLTRELKAYLDKRGVAYTERESGGFVDVVPVDPTSPEALEAVTDFYFEQYPLSKEEIAELNKQTEELVAYLNDRGLQVTTTVTKHGIVEPDLDPTDPAVAKALTEFTKQEMAEAGMDPDEIAAFELPVNE